MAESHQIVFRRSSLCSSTPVKEDEAPSASVSLMHDAVQHETLTWACRRNLCPWCSAVWHSPGRSDQHAEGWADQLLLSWRKSTSTANGTFSFHGPWHSSDPLVTKPEKKNYFTGKKWPGEGARLAQPVICSVLTLGKGGFRSPEGKNKKVVREEEVGQPPSAQQLLAMAQLPWKEAIGWVTSPD